MRGSFHLARIAGINVHVTFFLLPALDRLYLLSNRRNAVICVAMPQKFQLEPVT